MIKNVDRMIDNATVVNDYKMNEFFISGYKYKLKHEKAMLRIFSIVAVIVVVIAVATWNFWREFLFFGGIVMAICIMGIFDTAKTSFKLNKGLKRIEENNSSLMCYESDIYEIKKQKVRYSEGSRKGYCYKYFCVLDFDINLELNVEMVEEFENKQYSKVKIYFYKELLELNEFEIKGEK